MFERLMNPLDWYEILESGVVVSKLISISDSHVGAGNKFVMTSLGGDWFFKKN